MRNNAGDVVDRESSLVEDFLRRVQHRGDGLFVHFLAGHVNCCQMHIDIFSCDWAARSAAGHKQDVSVATIAANMSADDPVRAAPMPQNSGASAVAEEHTAIPISPVSDRR